MSEDEQRQLIGSTAEELSDCRKQLACLQTKAERFRKQMASAAKILEECAELRRTTTPQAPSKAEDWPTFDDVVSIFEGCHNLKRRIHVLEERFREWGVLPKN